MANIFATYDPVRYMQAGSALAAAPSRNALQALQADALKQRNALSAYELEAAKRRDTALEAARPDLAAVARGESGAAARALGTPHLQVDLVKQVQGLRDSDIAANVDKLKMVGANMEALSSAALGIAQLPPGQQASAYQALKQRYAGMGLDVSGWPAQFGPEVIAVARQMPEAAKLLNERIAGAQAGQQPAPTFDRTNVGEAVDNYLLPSEGTGQNPNSTASGVGQFTDGTFLQEFRKAYPDLAAQMTDAEILEQKDDPEIGRALSHQYVSGTVLPAFEAIGIPNITAGQLKLGYMGPGRVRAIYGAPDDTPIGDVVDREALAANPQWQGLRTTGELKQWAEGNAARYGAPTAGQQTAGAPAGGGLPAQQGQSAASPRFLVTGDGRIATDDAPSGYGWTEGGGVAALPGYGAGGGQRLGTGNAVADRAFNSLVEQGFDPTLLAKVESGLLKTVVDPVTGEAHVVDLSAQGAQPGMLTGQSPGASPAQPQGGQAVQQAGRNGVQPPAPPQGIDVGELPTLFDLADRTAGIVPGLAETLTRVGPQIFPSAEGYQNVTTSRQYMQLAQNELVRALMQNPRFSEGERQSIRKEIAIAPAAFDSPQALRSRLRAIDQFLRAKLPYMQRDASDPGLPADYRRQQLSSARAVERFLDLAGVPPTFYSDQQLVEAARAGDVAPGDPFYDDRGRLLTVPEIPE